MIKKEAKDVIEKLNNSGIKTIMLTGDNYTVANKVGREVGIQEIKAEMLPQDKYNEVEKMKKESNKNGKAVAFVRRWNK